MSEIIEPGSDPILDAVKSMNSGYKNTDYSKRQLLELGTADVYAVSFKGPDEKTYEHFACNARGRVFAASTLERLLLKINGRVFLSFREPELIKLGVVSILAFAFSVATIVEVATWPNNPSLEILSGTAALLIGYLVGKSGDTKA